MTTTIPPRGRGRESMTTTDRVQPGKPALPGNAKPQLGVSENRAELGLGAPGHLHLRSANHHHLASLPGQDA
jgi:hypothetical protein